MLSNTSIVKLKVICLEWDPVEIPINYTPGTVYVFRSTIGDIVDQIENLYPDRKTEECVPILNTTDNENLEVRAYRNSWLSLEGLKVIMQYSENGQAVIWVDGSIQFKPANLIDKETTTLFTESYLPLIQKELLKLLN